VKGLASKETHAILAQAASRDIPQVPEIFWCKDSLSEKNDCCFWHYIFYPNGGPERDGIYHPLYAYEIDILDKMQMERLDSQRDHTVGKCFCVYKATGLGLKPHFLNSETIALLEQSERDILESQILGLFGYLQQESNRVVFFTTLCKNLPKESRRQYMKDSISMLKQVLKKIRKQRAQSSHQGS
jgi:hypothetical protein